MGTCGAGPRRETRPSERGEDFGMVSCQHRRSIASSLEVVDGHGRIGRPSAHDLVLTKLNLEERNRGVRSFNSDEPPTLRLTPIPFAFPRTPLPIAQNPSVCVDRRAALQRNGSQRFPQG